MNNQQEIWRDIRGYEGLYKISNLGRVYSFLSKKILKPNKKTKIEYLYVVLHKNGKAKTCVIHRLIALAFIPNPSNKPCIDHIDGNRHNNKISNLRWVTHKENTNNPVTKVKFKKAKKNRKSNPKSWFKKLSKPIICIEAQMIFESINEAGRILNIDARKICQVCKGKIQTFGGYHWEYVKKEAC